MQAAKANHLGHMLVWSVLGILLIYAASGMLISLLPVTLLVKALGGLSGSGDASAMVADRFQSLVGRARGTSTVLLGLWMVLFWRRRWLFGVLVRITTAITNTLADAPRRALTAAQSGWANERFQVIVLLSIIGVGIGLRWHYLSRDLRHDEAWTYMVYGRRPFWLSPLVLTDVNHHPLNTLLIQLSVALFGNGPAAIRLPAFLFGVGCIPAGYALALAVWGRGTALIAAALIAGASPLIEYSVNARGYSAVTFFTLSMLWAGQRALQYRNNSVSTWPVVALAAITGSYANIVMVLPGIMAFTWFTLLAFGRGWQEIWQALWNILITSLAIVVGVLFLYLPFFTVNGWDAITSSQGIKVHESASTALTLFPTFIEGLLTNWSRDFWPVCAEIAVVLAFASILMASRNRQLCLALLSAMVAALLFQFVLVRDPGPERIWLSFLPPLLILVSAGLNGILSRLSRLPNLPGMVALGLVTLMAIAVIRSATLLTSTETGYFPAAQEIALSLMDSGRSDFLEITGVRGDDVAYFTLRDGLILQPIRTDGVLRLYRPINVPDRPGSGKLTIVIDKLLQFCTIQECLDQAQAIVPFSSAPTLERETRDYTEFRVPRATP